MHQDKPQNLDSLSWTSSRSQVSMQHLMLAQDSEVVGESLSRIIPTCCLATVLSRWTSIKTSIFTIENTVRNDRLIKPLTASFFHYDVADFSLLEMFVPQAKIVTNESRVYSSL